MPKCTLHANDSENRFATELRLNIRWGWNGMSFAKNDSIQWTGVQANAQKLVLLLHKDQVVDPLSRTVNISNNTISCKFGNHFFQPGLNSVRYFPWRLNNTNNAFLNLYMVFLGINTYATKNVSQGRRNVGRGGGGQKNVEGNANL